MLAALSNKVTEVIFLGLPGPTHNYGGLSSDNRASRNHQGLTAYPQEAALQVLSLARLLISLGITVAILPPQLRPSIKELRHHFTGSDADIIAQAAKKNPGLLEAVSSSAAMWTANAATVTPVQDNEDHKLHITVANLHTNLHRRIEALDTYLVLRQIFSLIPHCIVDMPLKAEQGFRDEGDANHMRLCPSHSAPGLNIFVYGADDSPRDPKTARQTLRTSQEIITRHHLPDERAICIKQNPLAIEAGVFHNDVIAVANESMLLVHEDAYAMGGTDIDYIRRSYEELTSASCCLRVVSSHELSLAEAVDTYFFNSQLITLPDGNMAIIAPTEVETLHDGKGKKLLEDIIADPANPITHYYLIDLHQSMQNGGGPACLRLRVPMDGTQLAAMREHKRVIMDETKLIQLRDAIMRTYPQELTSENINYDLYLTCQEALQAIGICLGLDLLPG